MAQIPYDMRIFSKTDAGVVRTLNDDSFLHGYLEGGSVWAVVCDGIGGFNGGAVASSCATQVIGQKLSSGFRKGMSGNSLRNLLNTAIVSANINILDKAMEDRALDGMGTTVVAAVICDGFVHIAYAGDSRAYLISQNSVQRLTDDHSVVRAMIDCGQLTESEARNHPRRNLITRALGIDENIDVDYCECPYSLGDKLLLCTDGLSNYVDEAKILEITNTSAVENLPAALIDYANKMGGADNATAVIICD